MTANGRIYAVIKPIKWKVFINPHRYIMIKDLTNFVRSFVYGEPPFPVCADSLYILKHILSEQIFVIVFAICVVGAFIGRPPWWNILFSHICFDVINVVYRICTHCVQTVCIAHGLHLQYNNCFAAFIKFNLLWKFCRYLRASDERPYSLVCTNN